MKKIINNNKTKFGIVLCTIIFVYACLTHEYGLNIFSSILGIFTIILDYLYFFQNKIFEKIIDKTVKYRFLIALLVFIILVLFKISGSSIGMYDSYFVDKNDENETSLLYGEPKSIRSDEWLVMTSYYFSQTYNDNKVISNYLSLDGQNMIIGYNSPVWDITILAKPLVWGYLLFGNEYGISWYWVGKTILFILASFEICSIITKGNKKLSIIGSLLVSFGPSTLWWFAPHMPDVILWFMVLLSMIYHLVSNKKEWIRNILTIIIPFAALEYVVALFPSFQVGLGYFLLALFIMIMIRDKNKFYKDKKSIVRILIVGIISIGLVGYFLINNIDALKATSGTVYPGSRMETGGNLFVKDLFTDLATPLLGYRNTSPYSNQSEDSTYIHFGMFIMMLLPALLPIMKKEKNRNRYVGIGIASVMGIYAIFMIIGFPEILSKLTFFRYINRMKMIFGLIAVFFTIWGFNEIENHGKKIDNKYYVLAVLAYALLNISFIDQTLKNYMPLYFYCAEIAVFAIILLMIKFNYKEVGYAILIGLLAFSSLTINPIITGISSITNHPSTTFINKIVDEDPDAYWIGYDSVAYPDYLLTIGAKTINATNFYPDFAKWKIIDPDNKYEENWNRYSYIIIKISEDKNKMTNEFGNDSVVAYITSDTIEKLGVKYILSSSSNDLTFYNSNEYEYKEIYKDNSVKIYELEKIEKKEVSKNKK